MSVSISSHLDSMKSANVFSNSHKIHLIIRYLLPFLISVFMAKDLWKFLKSVQMGRTSHHEVYTQALIIYIMYQCYTF